MLKRDSFTIIFCCFWGAERRYQHSLTPNHWPLFPSLAWLLASVCWFLLPSAQISDLKDMKDGGQREQETAWPRSLHILLVNLVPRPCFPVSPVPPIFQKKRLEKIGQTLKPETFKPSQSMNWRRESYACWRAWRLMACLSIYLFYFFFLGERWRQGTEDMVGGVANSGWNLPERLSNSCPCPPCLSISLSSRLQARPERRNKRPLTVNHTLFPSRAKEKGERGHSIRLEELSGSEKWDRDFYRINLQS